MPMTEELNADDERSERIERLAENLRDVLKDGDEVLIQFLNDEMRISESWTSKLRAEQPRLHGRLLSIDQQLESSWLPYVACLLAAGVLLFGLQVGWWEGVFGEVVCEKLNTWWFYLVAFALAFYAGSLFEDWHARRTYARHRASLVTLMTECGYDRDLLVSQMNNESEFNAVLTLLKRDTEDFPPVKAPPPPRLFEPKDEKK
jgi:hypothetical protein